MADAELATAWIRLQPSFRGLKEEIAKEIDGVPTDKMGQRAGSNYASGVKRNLAGLGKLIAGAFAVNKVIDGMTAAVNAASDLQEAGTAVQEIFGESFRDIEKWSKGAAKALGQSQLEALNAVKTFGIYGKSAGLAGEANVEFSTTMAELATDLASFNNTSPQEAVEALGAALRGENEPIRKYGVLLDDATLRQKALALGIIETTKDALTPQQKVLAAQAAIMEQTGTAQGDFERTSESLANKQRILNAEWENFTAELGEELLPAITDIVTGLNDDLLPALRDTLDMLKELEQQEWFSGFVDALGTGGDLNFITSTGFIDNLVEKWNKLPENLAIGWDQIKAGNKAASDAIEAEFVAWLGRIGANFDGGREQINQGVYAMWEGITSKFAGGWEQISTWWNDGWDGFGQKLETGRQQINTGVTLFWDSIVGKFRGGWEQITGAFSNGWRQISDFMGRVGRKVDEAKGKFEAAGKGIRDAFRGIGQFLKDAFGPVADLVGGIGNAFKTFFGGAGDRARHVKGKAQEAASSVGGGGAALARVRATLPTGLRVTDTLSNPVRDRLLGLNRSVNSYHYDAKNPAVDIAGPTWLLDQYAAKLRAMGGWRQLLWRTAGHYDHIHVAHTGGVVDSSWYRSPGDKWDERTVRLQVGETVLPKGVSPVNASYDVGASNPFEGMTISGALEIVDDGLVRIVDGRITAYDNTQKQQAVRRYATKGV